MMKKFILQIIIFGIGLLGAALGADYTISKNLRKPTTSQMLSNWNNIYSGKIQSDVVIMGSSRAWVQYSPHILDSILGINSYNLGIDGSPINRQIIVYDTYRRFNPKPKWIIQDIDFGTINKRNGYRREQFFPYFFDDSLKKAITEYEKYNLLETCFPIYRYAGYNELVKIGLGLIKFGETDLVKGYSGKNKEWDGKKFKEQKEIFYAQDSAMLSLFDKYLARAYSENIKVIFVYAPMYIGATEKVINIEGMYQMYDSIAQKYDIPILDYNYNPISYDTAYFYNAMHLNKKGSELFSIKLAHDIDSLGIILRLENR